MSILAIGGLLLAVCWVVLVLRANKLPSNATLPARVGINREQYDTALASIDQAQAAGEISEALAAQERQRLQLQLVRATDADSDERRWEKSISMPVRIGFLILPLSIAVLTFFATGGAMHWPQPQSANAAEGGAPPDVEQMVARLAERLESNPDDHTGWVMLGRSYMIMQRFDQAARAWREANSRATTPDPDHLVAEAEAIGLAQNQSLEGRPLELIEQALTLDAQNIRALWFYALAAQARGEEELAFRTLDRLAQVPNLPADLRQTLIEIGVPLPETASGSTAKPNEYALNIEVALGEQLSGQTPPGSTLFVFARTPSGPPMPVAADRLPIGSWPATVQLNDSKSMLAGRVISEQGELEIVARISASGAAKASPGDWEGRLRWTNQPAGGKVAVTIDRVVP